MTHLLINLFFSPNIQGEIYMSRRSAHKYPTLMLYGLQITTDSFSSCIPYKIVMFVISLDLTVDFL